MQAMDYFFVSIGNLSRFTYCARPAKHPLFFSLFFFFYACGVCYIVYALHQPHLEYTKQLFISVIQQRQQL